MSWSARAFKDARKFNEWVYHHACGQAVILRIFDRHMRRTGRIGLKWLILAVFVFGMISSLNWYEAVTRERKMAFGLMTIAAFAVVLVLGNTIL